MEIIQLGVYTSKPKSLCTAFLNSIKLSEYRIGIKFDKEPLVCEQNNYLSKILNVWIAYVLDAWAWNPTNNFKFENFIFRDTIIVKSSDKEKYLYSWCWIIFVSTVSCNFDNDTAKNALIFVAENSLSSHGDSRKNLMVTIFNPIKQVFIVLLSFSSSLTTNVFI